MHHFMYDGITNDYAIVLPGLRRYRHLTFTRCLLDDHDFAGLPRLTFSFGAIIAVSARIRPFLLLVSELVPTAFLPATAVWLSKLALLSVDLAVRRKGGNTSRRHICVRGALVGRLLFSSLFSYLNFFPYVFLSSEPVFFFMCGRGGEKKGQVLESHGTGNGGKVVGSLEIWNCTYSRS